MTLVTLVGSLSSASAQNHHGALIYQEPDLEPTFPSVWEEHLTQPTVNLFFYPAATTAAAIAGLAYVPLGMSIRLSDDFEWTLEASFLYGDFYGCESTTVGGWLASGVSVFLGADNEGWFLWPKLIGRYFLSSGAQSGGLLGCSASEASQLNEADYEIHGGLDFGYRFTFGDFTVTPVVGLSAGYCGNCIEGGAFFSGDPSDLFEHGPRANKASLGLNLNLVRLGMRF